MLMRGLLLFVPLSPNLLSRLSVTADPPRRDNHMYSAEIFKPSTLSQQSAGFHCSGELFQPWLRVGTDPIITGHIFTAGHLVQ